MSQGKLADFYKSNIWNKIRKAVLERDCYCCQYDGCTDAASVVHHWKEYLTEDNMWTSGIDMDNLISYCRFHHEKLHGRLTEDDEEDEYCFDDEGQLVPRRKDGC